MTVMLIVSIISRIAIPQFQDILTRARATEIRASFTVVEEAATRLTVEGQPWPADVEAGIVPPELVDMLSPGFGKLSAFTRARQETDLQ